MTLHFPIDGDLNWYGARLNAAWRTLETKYATRLSPVQLDYLLARYALGLTLPAWEARPPADHLEMLRGLLSRVLDPGRVEAVLSCPVESGEEWIDVAFDSIERLGLKDGKARLDAEFAGVGPGARVNEV